MGISITPKKDCLLRLTVTFSTTAAELVSVFVLPLRNPEVSVLVGRPTYLFRQLGFPFLRKCREHENGCRFLPSLGLWTQSCFQVPRQFLIIMTQMRKYVKQQFFFNDILSSKKYRKSISKDSYI
jgi:hypothetical protein